MKIPQIRKSIVLIFAILLPAPSAWPSACEPFGGEWTSSKEVTQQQISDIQSLLFSGAYKVLTPRGDVRLKAGAPALADSYSVTLEWQSDVWLLRFFEGKKEAGKWRLTATKDWDFFQTDPGIPQIANPSKPVPVLYKEVRIGGTAEPEGIFSSEAGQKLHYRLIFQGRGSRCFECGDFKRWIFQIEGPDPDAAGRTTVYYSFFGSFEKGC